MCPYLEDFPCPQFGAQTMTKFFMKVFLLHSYNVFHFLFTILNLDDSVY